MKCGSGIGGHADALPRPSASPLTIQPSSFWVPTWVRFDRAFGGYYTQEELGTVNRSDADMAQAHREYNSLHPLLFSIDSRR